MPCLQAFHGYAAFAQAAARLALGADAQRPWVARSGAYDSHGAEASADVRVLAVGYSAGSASTPELLKISSTPAFSLLRSWKTCVRCARAEENNADANPGPRASLRATRAGCLRARRRSWAS